MKRVDPEREIPNDGELSIFFLFPTVIFFLFSPPLNFVLLYFFIRIESSKSESGPVQKMELLKFNDLFN